MNKLQTYFKHKTKSKKGNVALETVISGTAIILLFAAIIGYFTYLYPRYMIDLEVQQFSQNVRMNGYANQSSIDIFVANMEERGYDESDVMDGLSVTSHTGDDLNAYTNSNAHELLVERNDGQITIDFSVQANIGLLGDILTSDSWFLGGGSSSDDEMEESVDNLSHYQVRRVVGSEVYLPQSDD